MHPRFQTNYFSLITLLVFPLGAPASPASAQREYESRRYTEAQKEYERLLAKKPADDRLQYNAGTAAFRADDFENAARHFNTAKTSRDLQLQQRAFYNLGNTLYRKGENSTEPDEKTSSWEDAIKNFDGALKLAPQDKDAEFNRNLVQQRLEELKKQQQKQDKPKDGKDNKDDKKDDKDSQGKDDQKNDKSGENQKKQDQSKDDQKKPGEDKPKDQKNGNDPKKDEKKDDKGKPDEQKKSDQPDGKKPDKDPQAGKGQPQKDGDKPDGANARQGGSQQVAIMSPEQAKQLLDSQKGEEKALIFQPTTVKPKASNRLFKDW